MTWIIKSIIAWWGFVLFVIGLLVGFTVKNIPFVSLNDKVSFYELADVILTMVIAVWIPFLLKRLIEDNRYIKESLVSEVKEIICSIQEIWSVMSKHFANWLPLDNEDKDYINWIFTKIELQTSSLGEQMQISFESQKKETLKDLSNQYGHYERYLTAKIMRNNPLIETALYQENCIEQSKLITYLKTLIHKIYKL